MTPCLLDSASTTTIVPGRVALLGTPVLATSDAFGHAVARLEREFPDRRSAVSAVVRRCRRDLAGTPPGALPELLERLARQRLRDGAV